MSMMLPCDITWTSPQASSLFHYTFCYINNEQRWQCFCDCAAKSIYITLQFYYPGFYIFHKFMHFLHGPSQMSIIMLKKKFFHFSLLHIFSEFSVTVSTPDYERLPSFTYCSSALRTSYSRQWASVPATSHKWFSLKICTTHWLMHRCKGFVHTMWFH
jgi:hypothetical protein